MSKRHIASLIILTLFAATAAAGEFADKTVDPSLSWKPTECSNPRKLFFHIYDIDSYNAAVEEYNHYIYEMRTYRSCINDEAQSDAKAATKAIASGLERANDQTRIDLDAARSELETAKKLLQ